MLYVLVEVPISKVEIDSILNNEKTQYDIIILDCSIDKIKQQILGKCNRFNDQLICFKLTCTPEQQHFIKFLFDEGFSYACIQHDIFNPSRKPTILKDLQQKVKLISIINGFEPFNKTFCLSYDFATNSISLHSTRKIQKNELIYDLSSLRLVHKNNQYVITKNKNDYYDTEECFIQYMNHSCKPNVVVSNRENGDFAFISYRDMSENEELTYNYTTTEYISAAPFMCSCQNDNCIGAYTGFKYLKDEEKKELKAKNICTRYINETNE
jgi:hypothetical protein